MKKILVLCIYFLSVQASEPDERRRFVQQYSGIPGFMPSQIRAIGAGHSALTRRAISAQLVLLSFFGAITILSHSIRTAEKRSKATE